MGPHPLLLRKYSQYDNFDQAFAVAKMPDKRPINIELAIQTFAEVQEFFRKQRGVKQLNSPYVLERLKKTLKLAPNHLSAKNLLLSATKKEPRNLTL